MDAWTKLINALVPLIQSFVWPGLVLFISLYFGKDLKKFINNVKELTGKVGPTGLEWSAKGSVEAAAEAGFALAKATDKQNKSAETEQNIDDDAPEAIEEQGRKVAQIVSQAVSPDIAKKLSGSFVLWIDSQPLNSIYERSALEAISVKIDIIQSLKIAVDYLKDKKYNCIIFNIDPAEDNEEIDLFSDYFSNGRYAVFSVLYNRSGLQLDKEKAFERGFYDVANTPQELFQVVVEAVEKQPLIYQYWQDFSRRKVYESESAVFHWLKSKYAQKEIKTPKNPYNRFDFLIHTNNEVIGIDVKYFSNRDSFFAIDSRHYLRDRASRGVDQSINELMLFMVFPSKNLALYAIKRIPNLDEFRPKQLRKMSLHFGYLTNKQLTIEASISSED